MEVHQSTLPISAFFKFLTNTFWKVLKRREVNKQSKKTLTASEVLKEL